MKNINFATYGLQMVILYKDGISNKVKLCNNQFNILRGCEDYQKKEGKISLHFLLLCFFQFISVQLT